MTLEQALEMATARLAVASKHVGLDPVTRERHWEALSEARNALAQANEIMRANRVRHRSAA